MAMMSETSFLLELLLEHKLTKPTQTAIKERIKELEAAPTPQFVRPQAQVIHQQAPSTQALLAKQEAAIAQAEASGVVQAPPTASVPRMVGGEVNTGNGLRGPRKF